MLNEFKQFAMRGNVMDLAIGVIIGAAFGKIIHSSVGDIFTFANLTVYWASNAPQIYA